MSKAELENALRLEILEVCRAALAEHFDLDPVKQIENVSAGEITLPLCDAEGNEKYPVLKVSIPRGTRNGSGYDPYDGHAAAVAYQEEQEEKAAKKAASAAKKEAEAKAREARREAKKVVKELNEKGLDKMVKGE